MRRFKKILKWIASILLVLIAGVTVVVMARQNLKYDAPYPNIHASADSAVIARGKHLIFSSAHCINCHNRNNPDSLVALGQDVPLSGGVLFDVGIAKIYSKNITPDKETGIGKYTDQKLPGCFVMVSILMAPPYLISCLFTTQAMKILRRSFPTCVRKNR